MGTQKERIRPGLVLNTSKNFEEDSPGEEEEFRPMLRV